MNFSEQPPSKEWAVLKYRGEKIAEVWFKPNGEPFALTFRIPQKSFYLPGMEQRLTPENLLNAVALAAEDVESWRYESAPDSGRNGTNSALSQPLPPPPQDVSHLTVHLHLKPPQADSPTERGEPEIPLEKWQDLESRWKAIEVVEVSIDMLRQRMESLRTEMEAATRKTLTADEKVHALNADVAVWNKAKSRVHFALPKVREFIHRATWAMGLPERKNLEKLFKNPSQTPILVAQMDKLREQLEYLLKDRQVLAAHGQAVCQECQGIATEIQGALRTLQNNAVAKARQKMAEGRKKGKFI